MISFTFNFFSDSEHPTFELKFTSMTKLLLTLLIIPFLSFGQIKQIAYSELSTGSGMFLSAEMNAGTSQLSVTVAGPDDRYIAFGFGSGSGMSGDALIYSNAGGPNDVRDHFLAGFTTPPTDPQQDWTIVSNTVNAGLRTIVATRALNTGDGNDATFNFAATSQLFFWAKASAAGFTIQYHGGANRGLGISRNWILLDQTAPTLSSTVPVDGISGVSLTTNLSATFNENIQLGSGAINLYNGAGTLIETASNGSAGLSISGSTLTWNPIADLVPNTNYYVQISDTTIRDAAGNFYLGIADATTWNFNTNDIIPPTISGAFSPTDNSVGVALNVNLVASFSEAVQVGTGTIDIYDSNALLIESFNAATSPQLSISGSVLTINPTADFVLNTSYYINISATAIQDLSGNSFAGITNSTTWNFNTNDIIAPVISGAFSPADNFVGVPVATNFVVTYSENIQLGTGNFTIYKADNSIFTTINTGSAEVTVSGNQLIVDPIIDLVANDAFYILINNGFVTDLSNNPASSVIDLTAWNFNTSTSLGPILLIDPFNPLDNSLNAPLTGTFSASFNTNLFVNNTAGFVSLYLANGTLIESKTATDLQLSSNQLLIQWTNPLLELTDYYITMSNDLLRDVNGDPFIGFSDNQTWNFRTGDFTAPLLVTNPFVPADNSSNVDVAAPISVTFNEPIQLGTGDIQLSELSLGLGTTVYSFTSNPSAITIIGNTLSIQPVGGLATAGQYAVTISPTAILDTSANQNAFIGIGDQSTWNFNAALIGLKEYEEQQLFTWNNETIVLNAGLSGIRCYNTNGALVKSTTDSSLKLTNLSSGIYLIRIAENDNLTRIYVD